MSEVSIIINGVRYDAVDEECAGCAQCDLRRDCDESKIEFMCYALVPLCIFKKSTKSFEP